MDGGSWDTPDLDEGDLFAQAVERVLGDRIRADEIVARAVWEMIAGVDWVHANGDTALYSWRLAGDILAAIRGNGNYMDWYGKYCVQGQSITDEGKTAMATQGWSPSRPPALDSLSSGDAAYCERVGRPPPANVS